MFLQAEQLFLPLHQLALHLFNLLFQRHHEVGLLLILLSRLCHRCEHTSRHLLMLLRVHDKLTLCIEVFNCAFFASVFRLQDFNLRLQLDVFFFVLIVQLFQTHNLFLQVFRFFRKQSVACLTTCVVCRSCLHLGTVMDVHVVAFCWN